jgi:hypothetical protein
MLNLVVRRETARLLKVNIPKLLLGRNILKAISAV